MSEELTKQNDALLMKLAALSRRYEESLRLLSLISSITELSAKAADAVDTAREIMLAIARDVEEVAGCSLMVYDAQSEELRLFAASGPQDVLGEFPETANRTLHFRPGEGLAGEVFLTRQPVFWNEQDDQAEVLKTGQGLTSPRSLACLPLLHFDQCFGICNISFEKQHPFDRVRQRDLTMLGTVVANVFHAALQQAQVGGPAVDEDGRQAKLLELALESSDTATWDLDVAEGTLIFSDRFPRMTGYETEEFDNTFDFLTTLVHPEDLPEVTRRLQDHLAGRTEYYEVEYRLRTKSGSWNWMRDRGKVVARDSGGQPLRLVGTHTDISMRKGIESRLTHSEERYRTLYNSTPVMLQSTDIHGRLVSVSDHWLAVMGYERDEVLGRSATEFYTEASSKYILESAFPAFLRTGHARDVPVRLIRKDGEVMDVLISATAERDENGAVVRTLAVVMDITERLKDEDKIREALQEKETLLREIHHRVKNNMQIVSSLLNLQAERTKDQMLLAALADLRNRVSAMALIHEILYQSSSLAAIDLAAYIGKLMVVLSETFMEVSSRVEMVVEVEPMEIGLDRAIPCGLVINELVTNSFKHAFPGGRHGRVEVRAHLGDGDRIVLEVKDNGVGFPSAYNWRQTSTLGMSLVIGLMERQLHGTLEVLSAGGISFTMSFQRS